MTRRGSLLSPRGQLLVLASLGSPLFPPLILVVGWLLYSAAAPQS